MDPYVANTQTQLQIYRPRAGWKLIGLDVELSNQGSKAQRFYAMLGLNLRGTLKDPEGRPREFHSEPWFTTKAPDGLIGPNSSMRGWAVFQVPDNGGPYQLIFRPAPFASGEIHVALS